MRKELLELREYYRSSSSTSRKGRMKYLFLKYFNNKTALTDALTSALALNAMISDTINYDELSPQLKEAFELANPNTDISSLVENSGSEVAGFINNTKGKYFEILVRDGLNNGETFGDIALSEGQKAVLAESINQPGWDLQILNHDGSIDTALQLKATSSLGYIKEALDKYPDIDILSTSEVFNSDNISDDIFNSGISNQEIKEQTSAPFDNLLDSDLTDFLENVLPFLPFVVISISEGRKYFIHKKAFDAVFRDFTYRSIKTGTAMAAGSLVFAITDSGLVSIPTAILVRLSIDRLSNLSKISKSILAKSDELRNLRLGY